MSGMKVTPNAAMRARDISRPHPEHLAEAEAADAKYLNGQRGPAQGREGGPRTSRGGGAPGGGTRGGDARIGSARGGRVMDNGTAGLEGRLRDDGPPPGGRDGVPPPGGRDGVPPPGGGDAEGRRRRRITRAGRGRR